jgi:hypothetical protein
MTKIIYRVEVEAGITSWFNEYGQRHREDGPAIEWSDGHKEWYRNGQLHREDGPAVEWADGTKYWYRNNQCHREDSPAIELPSGNKEWYRNGQLHREDGPAIEWSDGTKFWYLDGKKLTEKEFLKRTQDQPSCDGKVVEIDGKKYKLTEV